AVGRANTARSRSAGCTEARSATVTPTRTIHPPVANTDRYMWSRTNTWSRSTESRSSRSGRSWWAIVATVAWRRATWASRAIVTLSRKRRCTRAETVRRNQVPALDAASPSAATTTAVRSPSTTPRPRRAIHSATRASGRASSTAMPTAAAMRRGSWRKPSRHSRHIAGSGRGRSVAWRAAARASSGEDIERHPLLVLRDGDALREALGLEVEHRGVAPAGGQELVVGPELDDPTALDDGDAVGLAHPPE